MAAGMVPKIGKYKGTRGINSRAAGAATVAIIGLITVWLFQ
jgi:hypothetical protein